MATQNPPVSQTRAFTTVFMIELWERFGYYGMQALIIYYMVQRLGFADERANLTWSAAAALIYVAPAIGGWIGDKVLGTRRTMLLGALGVIVVGNGLFKANAGNLVRKIYEGDDSRIDSAFTIYYMAVNIGSTFSMLLTPWIKDYVNATWGHELGWHAAFGICCVGLIVGLIIYAFLRASMRHVGSAPDALPVDKGRLLAVLGAGVLAVGGSAAVLQYEGLARAFVIIAGIVVLGIFIHLIRASEKSERAGLIAALVLTIQPIFFFI